MQEAIKCCTFLLQQAIVKFPNSTKQQLPKWSCSKDNREAVFQTPRCQCSQLKFRGKKHIALTFHITKPIANGGKGLPYQNQTAQYVLLFKHSSNLALVQTKICQNLIDEQAWNLFTAIMVLMQMLSCYTVNFNSVRILLLVFSSNCVTISHLNHCMVKKKKSP